MIGYIKQSLARLLPDVRKRIDRVASSISFLCLIMLLEVFTAQTQIIIGLLIVGVLMHGLLEVGMSRPVALVVEVLHAALHRRLPLGALSRQHIQRSCGDKEKDQ